MADGDPEVQAEISRLVADIIAAGTPRAEAWKKFQSAPHALELDELHAIALTGLAQAAARFPAYNAEHGYAPGDFRYFAAYCLRRMRGAMLDAMRSQDWVTRSARTRVKAIREAGQDQGRTTAELAKATGLTEDEVLEAVAMAARKPVSIDAEPHDVADPGDVEGQAVVASVLGAASAVLRTLPAYAQVIIVLRHFHGLPLADAIAAAKPEGVSEEKALEVYQGSILKVHTEMMRAVA